MAGSKSPHLLAKCLPGCPLDAIAPPNAYEQGAIYELRDWNEFHARTKMFATRKTFASGAQKDESIVDDLKALINRYSIENESNTPDFILAQFIREVMKAYATGLSARDKWFGFEPWGPKGDPKVPF